MGVGNKQRHPRPSGELAKKLTWCEEHTHTPPWSTGLERRDGVTNGRNRGSRPGTAKEGSVEWVA